MFFLNLSKIRYLIKNEIFSYFVVTKNIYRKHLDFYSLAYITAVFYILKFKMTISEHSDKIYTTTNLFTQYHNHTILLKS